MLPRVFTVLYLGLDGAGPVLIRKGFSAITSLSIFWSFLIFFTFDSSPENLPWHDRMKCAEFIMVKSGALETFINL